MSKQWQLQRNSKKITKRIKKIRKKDSTEKKKQI